MPTPVCPEDTFAVGKHNPGKTGHWVKLCWSFSRVCVKCSMPVTARAAGAAGQDSSNVTDQSILCHGLQPEAPAKQKSFRISEAPSVSMFVPPHRWTQQLWVRQQEEPQLLEREGTAGGMGLMECPSAAWGTCQPTAGCPLLGVPRKQGKTYRFVYTHTHLSIYLPTASLFQGREIKIRF